MPHHRPNLLMELHLRHLTSNRLLPNNRNLNLSLSLSHTICSHPLNNLLRSTINNTITNLSRSTLKLPHTLLTRSNNKDWLGARACPVDITNSRCNSSHNRS